ncbi:9933_t:CDS:1, partial [Funneliformis geosporum]
VREKELNISKSQLEEKFIKMDCCLYRLYRTNKNLEKESHLLHLNSIHTTVTTTTNNFTSTTQQLYSPPLPCFKNMDEYFNTKKKE